MAGEQDQTNTAEDAATVGGVGCIGCFGCAFLFWKPIIILLIILALFKFIFG